MTALANRYVHRLSLFHVTNGNPNGDPDAVNLPRMGTENEQGFGQRRFAQTQNSKLYRTGRRAISRGIASMCRRDRS